MINEADSFADKLERHRRQSWFETFKQWGYFEEEADARMCEHFPRLCHPDVWEGHAKPMLEVK